jgi:hypothetical protein
MPRRQPPEREQPPASLSRMERRESDFRVRDRRRNGFVSVPKWVIEEYGARLGVAGLAVYVALCAHADWTTRECWPSLNFIANEIGTSRSTVERAIRLLKILNLLETEPRISPQGQQSNVFILTDPNYPGGPIVAVNNCTPPPVPLTAPRERDPGNEIQGNEGAPPPNAAPEENPEVGALVELWFSLLVCPQEALRRSQRAEIGPEVAELLRRGYSPDQLRASLLHPERERTQFPRQWRAEVVKRPPARRRSPALQAADELARRAAEREAEARTAKAVLDQLGVKTLAEAVRERARRSGPG